MTSVLSLEKEIARVLETVSEKERLSNPGAIRRMDRVRKQLLILKAVLSARRQSLKEKL